MLFLVLSTPRVERPEEAAPLRRAFRTWMEEQRSRNVVRSWHLLVPRGVAAVVDVASNEALFRFLTAWADRVPASFDVRALVDPGSLAAEEDAVLPSRERSGPQEGAEEARAADLTIREADSGDDGVVVALIRELAASQGERSPVTEASVRCHRETPGGVMLLAETGGAVVGMLACSVRPDLYHGAPVCLVEELVVRAPSRGRGVGGALLDEVMVRCRAWGCAEISVTVMRDNLRGQCFYRRHGLVDEALFLERHFLLPE